MTTGAEIATMRVTQSINLIMMRGCESNTISDFFKQIVTIILCFLIAIYCSIGITQLYFPYLLISYILGCILQLFIIFKERKQ